MNKKIVSTVLVLSIILQFLFLELNISYVCSGAKISMSNNNGNTAYYTVPKRIDYTFNKYIGGGTTSTGLPSTYTHMGAYKISISFEYMDISGKYNKNRKNESFADGLLNSTEPDINTEDTYYQFGNKFRDRILSTEKSDITIVAGSKNNKYFVESGVIKSVPTFDITGESTNTTLNQDKNNIATRYYLDYVGSVANKDVTQIVKIVSNTELTKLRDIESSGKRFEFVNYSYALLYLVNPSIANKVDSYVDRTKLANCSKDEARIHIRVDALRKVVYAASSNYGKLYDTKIKYNNNTIGVSVTLLLGSAFNKDGKDFYIMANAPEFVRWAIGSHGKDNATVFKNQEDYNALKFKKEYRSGITTNTTEIMENMKDDRSVYSTYIKEGSNIDFKDRRNLDDYSKIMTHAKIFTIEGDTTGGSRDIYKSLRIVGSPGNVLYGVNAMMISMAPGKPVAKTYVRFFKVDGGNKVKDVSGFSNTVISNRSVVNHNQFDNIIPVVELTWSNELFSKFTDAEINRDSIIVKVDGSSVNEKFDKPDVKNAINEASRGNSIGTADTTSNWIVGLNNNSKFTKNLTYFEDYGNKLDSVLIADKSLVSSFVSGRDGKSTKLEMKIPLSKLKKISDGGKSKIVFPLVVKAKEGSLESKLKSSIAVAIDLITYTEIDRVSVNEIKGKDEYQYVRSLGPNADIADNLYKKERRHSKDTYKYSKTVMAAHAKDGSYEFPANNFIIIKAGKNTESPVKLKATKIQLFTKDGKQHALIDWEFSIDRLKKEVFDDITFGGKNNIGSMEMYLSIKPNQPTSSVNNNFDMSSLKITKNGNKLALPTYDKIVSGKSYEGYTPDTTWLKKNAIKAISTVPAPEVKWNDKEQNNLDGMFSAGISYDELKEFLQNKDDTAPARKLKFQSQCILNDKGLSIVSSSVKKSTGKTETSSKIKAAFNQTFIAKMAIKTNSKDNRVGMLVFNSNNSKSLKESVSAHSMNVEVMGRIRANGKDIVVSNKNLDISKSGEYRKGTKVSVASVGVLASEVDTNESDAWVPEKFSYHSNVVPEAFSELKANEPRNEDWNVLGGVPSTEKLFVASGGTKFQVDVSGIVEKQENINRKITFKYRIVNSWGSNDPDQLSNTVHTIFTANGSDSVMSPAGSGTNTKKMADGSTLSASGWMEYPPPPPKGPAPAPIPMTSTCTGSWSYTLYFDDATGEFRDSYSASGGGGKIASFSQGNIRHTNEPKKMNKWGQAFFMTGPVSITSNGTFKGTSSVIEEQAIINHGYTVGTGTTVTQRVNAFHPIEEVGEISFYESIPQIYYLNIKNYAVAGLYKGELTDFDNTLFREMTNNVSGQQLQAACYNIVGNGNYQSGNGRLWFTKPPQEDFKKGSGWKETRSNYAYWTGDWVIDITTNPDYKYAVENNNKLHSADVRSNAGCEDDGGNPTGGPNNKWHGFDGRLTPAAKKDFSAQVVEGDSLAYPSDKRREFYSAIANAWMNANNTLYSATVISDSLMIGALDNTSAYQDVISSIYPIDGGVKLFEKPFNAGSKETVKHDKARKNVTKAMLTEGVSPNAYNTVFTPDDITFDGYRGVVTDTYDTKYRRLGEVDQVTETREPLIKALRDEELLMRRFNKDVDTKWYYVPRFRADGNTQYAYCNPEYVTECKVEESNPTGNVTYNGYYETYDLSGAKDVGMLVTRTGRHLSKRSNIPDAIPFLAQNSSNANNAKYGFSLVHSNLNLVETARNKEYISPVTSSLVYGSLIENYEGGNGDFEEQDEQWPDSREFSLPGEYVKNFVNENGDYHKINSVVIHDPVSIEYCKVINYHNQVLSDNKLLEHDLRPTEDKIANKAKKYALIGSTMEIFYSDIGNFYDPNGSAALTHVTKDRAVGTKVQHITNVRPGNEIVVPRTAEVRDTATAGYTESMDTGRWAKNRYILLPFPCYIYDKNGNKVTYGKDEPIDISTFGTESMKEATMVKEDTTDKGVPGWVLKVFVLTSADELANGKVHFYTEAINKPAEFSEDVENNSGKTNKERIGFSAHHDAYNYELIDLVGRLGNLSISDTEDFRFSNLFRRPLPEWDIENVIRKVDFNTPNMVAADPVDILSNRASFETMGHSTEGMTYYAPYSNDYINILNRGIAKANGNYVSLPLTPAKNNVPEYRRDPMRMGYQLFLDIETIGNYYGQAYNNERQSNDRGIIIQPHYVFYDLDTKEYIPIDIYYGAGTKKLIYRYGDDAIEGIRYEINSADEYGRRNIKSIETNTTDKVLNTFGNAIGNKKFNSVKIDDIGHTGLIRLDQFNRDFIGSSVLYSGVDYKGNIPAIVAKTPISDEQVTQNIPWNYEYNTSERALTNEAEFQKKNQRWFWKLGLASSSIIVPHGSVTPGESIEGINKRFRRDHPNGFVLNGAYIRSMGDVWNLEYNGEFINNGWIDYDVPRKPNDPNPPTVIRKIPGPKKVGKIDWRRLAWIVAYNPWNTSTDDKDIKGTH